MGRWLTRKIFYIVEGDFKSTLRQKNVPETVPSHPLREALSGALHVVPEGYLDLVRTKQIGIIQGSLQGVSDARATIRSTDGKFTKLKVDKILCATGYKIVSLKHPYLAYKANFIGVSLLLRSSYRATRPLF